VLHGCIGPQNLYHRVSFDQMSATLMMMQAKSSGSILAVFLSSAISLYAMKFKLLGISQSTGMTQSCFVSFFHHACWPCRTVNCCGAINLFEEREKTNVAFDNARTAFKFCSIDRKPN
jgi:hypothetical protein